MLAMTYKVTGIAASRVNSATPLVLVHNVPYLHISASRGDKDLCQAFMDYHTSIIGTVEVHLHCGAVHQRTAGYYHIDIVTRHKGH